METLEPGRVRSGNSLYKPSWRARLWSWLYRMGLVKAKPPMADLEALIRRERDMVMFGFIVEAQRRCRGE